MVNRIDLKATHMILMGPKISLNHLHRDVRQTTQFQYEIIQKFPITR